MAGEAARGGGDWRAGRGPTRSVTSPTRATAKKWSTASLLATLLIAVVLILGMILWRWIIKGAPSSQFVAFWVGEFQGRAGIDRDDVKRPRLSSLIPPILWMEADRKALEESRVFRIADTTEDKTYTYREVMKIRLDDLGSKNADDLVVVYVASYAKVDEDGKVQILASDSDPYQPKTLLPLSTVLTALKTCPSKQKLLVLDIVRTTPDPFDLGGPTAGMAELIRTEIQRTNDTGKTDDPDFVVIGSCDVGQTALGSELLGQSVFGHFFRLGLTSQEADTNRDRVITVHELAAFLKVKVDQWAVHYRGVSQRPYLAGALELDFPITALTRQSRLSFSWPWKKSSTPPQSALSDQTPAKEKTAEKGTAKEKAGTDKIATDSDGRSYPEWLTSGWKLRDQWYKGNEFLAAPRAFLRLEVILLRAEQRWRSGAGAGIAQGELENELRTLQGEMKEAKAFPRPAEFRSVGQATALDWKHDAELALALQDLLSVPVALIDPKKKPEWIEKHLKEKTSLALAGAIVDTADNIPFDPKTLAFLDSLVSESRLPRNVVELRFLNQLAARLARDANDKRYDALAKQAWKVVLASEMAGSQPTAFPWVRDQLTQADALRHAAEVLLLSDTWGYASLDQIQKAWDKAERAYQTIRDFQDRLRTALARRGRALVLLRFSVPFLEEIADPEYERVWLDTAETIRSLDPLLVKPEQGLSIELLTDLSRKLDDLNAELNKLSNVLERPYQDSALDELADECLSPARPSPASAHTLAAIVATPFPSARQRSKLWLVGRKLDRKLANTPPAESETSSNATALGDELRHSNLLSRRARRLIALVALSGAEATAGGLEGSLALDRQATDLKKETESDVRQDLANAGKLRSEVARFMTLVHGKFLSLAGKTDALDGRDRAGWIVPIFLLDWQRNPTLESRIRDADAAWPWLADHYLHEARDLHEPALDDNPTFYQTAAGESWACVNERGGIPPETYVEFGPKTTHNLVLSRSRPGDDAVVELILHSPDTEHPQTISLAALSPDDPRLRITLPTTPELELVPNKSSTVTVRVRWEEADQAQAMPTSPQGFIIQAKLPNQRSYHQRVPLVIDSESQRLRLVLKKSADPAQGEELPFERLYLRPIAGRQPFYLFVYNPTPTPRDLLVELPVGDPPKPVKVKVKAAARSTTPVLNLPPPGPKASEHLNKLTGPLRFRLLEDPENGTELDARTAQISIATPDDYLTNFLEITQARYFPANQPGDKNRLTVTLRARAGLTGPPIEVDLGFPEDKELLPAIREPPKQGTLSGSLEPGKPLMLFAEDLTLDPRAPEETGLFFLNIDGIDRALWFQTQFARAGSPQKVTQDRTTRVRFVPEIKSEPPPAMLRVRFVVDNAPGEAKLRFRIGRENAAGVFVEDHLPWNVAAKERYLGFDPGGESGALLFEADIKDQEKEFNTRGLRGERELVAEIWDSGNRTPLARYAVPVTLDDQPPVVESLEVPKEVLKNTSVPALATVIPPASKITEALFFFGTKADAEKAKGANLAVPGRPTDESARTWTARLPLPKEVIGKLAVTVRFTSGVNLSDSLTAEVMVVAPVDPEPAKDAGAAEKKQPTGPGAIKGVVIGESRLPQPGLEVLLITLDPDAKDKNKLVDTQKTTPQGAYLFKDVKPGRYRVSSSKVATNRSGFKDVTVVPGKTTQAEIELLLP